MLPLSDCYPAVANSISVADAIPNVWRADTLGRMPATCVSTGFPNLDAALPGGGWPASVLVELLWTHVGSGEFRLVAPTLAALTARGRMVALLAPAHVPLAPGLTQLGIDVSRVLVITADKPGDSMWAAEQTLKSGAFGALLAWLPQVRAEQLRRLQLAAANSDGLVFLYRPGRARDESSPAPLRLHCRPAPAGRIAVDIFKRRGPVAAEPIVLEPLLPIVIQYAFTKQPRPSNQEPRHVVDRLVPATASARSGVSALAS